MITDLLWSRICNWLRANNLILVVPMKGPIRLELKR